MRLTLIPILLLLAMLARADALDRIGGTVGGGAQPGLDMPQLDALQQKAEQATQDAQSEAGDKQNHFIVRGYPKLAENCTGVDDPQVLLNCERANLLYLQYGEAGDAAEARALYRSHRQAADEAIEQYRRGDGR